MAEEVIDYSGKKNSNWFQNKFRGLKNRYHIYKRYSLWYVHTLLHKIEPDYTKLPKDAIPVLINNFNRLELLEKQIAWLLSLEDKVSIIIVDNKSTYPPLLDFYKKINHPLVQVVYLDFNSWRKGVEYLGEQKLKDYEKFIITDSDLLPFPNTPKNLVSHLSQLMDKYPEYNHIGTSLEINDLPDENPMKEKVVHFESNYWEPIAEVLNNEVYVAKIDSTFAMYRRGSRTIITHPSLRTMRPYTLKHIDWYLAPKDFSEEYIYYLKSCKSFATWATQLKKDTKVVEH